MIKSTDYRDFDLLIKQIITQDSSITPKIRNQSFSLLSKVLQRYELKPKLNSPQSTHPKVDKMFALLSSVQNGTYEDIKKYPFIEYNTINDKNYALKGNKNALDILKDSTKSLEVRQFALNIICDSQKEKDIQRALELAKECLNKEIVYKIIEVYALEHRLDSSEIGEYCKIAHFKSKDYVTLAKFLQPKLDPDRWIRFFTDLTNIDPKAKKSHLFTLLELEMIDRVIDELKGSEEEFLAIRAYIDLKKAGKNYSLDIFIPS